MAATTPRHPDLSPCHGHARRAQIATNARWNGHKHTGMLYAHGSLVAIQAARVRLAQRRSH